MTTELEDTLARELHEVADGVHVPPMPSVVPAGEPRPRAARRWQPLLVAAVVALVVGVTALVVSQQDGDKPQPAPPPSGTIPDTAPSVPMDFDGRFYIDGKAVPNGGGGWGLETRNGVWLAMQFDGTWWWGGPGVDPQMIEGENAYYSYLEQPPVISPNGRYIAYVASSGGAVHLTGFDTRPGGEGFGNAPVELTSSEDGVPIRVRAVTDEGDVIVQGTRTSLMWRALFEDQRTIVDLNETAPDQVILEGTTAGLVVVDGSAGATDATDTEPYLATISTDGHLDRQETLPTYSDLAVSLGGTWLVRAPAGSLGGEVTAVDTLRAQEIGSSDEVVLEAPEGWAFQASTWAWEDEEFLVAVLLPDRRANDPQLVRCSVVFEACRAFPAAGRLSR